MLEYQCHLSTPAGSEELHQAISGGLTGNKLESKGGGHVDGVNLSPDNVLGNKEKVDQLLVSVCVSLCVSVCFPCILLITNPPPSPLLT